MVYYESQGSNPPGENRSLTRGGGRGGGGGEVSGGGVEGGNL